MEKILTIKVDTEIEVTEKEYNYFSDKWKGYVAHREENGKYFLKLMMGGRDTIYQFTNILNRFR